MYAIVIKNADQERAEHALRRFRLPRNYCVSTEQSMALMFRAKAGFKTEVCLACGGKSECPFTGKRCPVGYAIDEVVQSMEALRISGVKAKIQI